MQVLQAQKDYKLPNTIASVSSTQKNRSDTQLFQSETSVQLGGVLVQGQYKRDHKVKTYYEGGMQLANTPNDHSNAASKPQQS